MQVSAIIVNILQFDDFKQSLFQTYEGHRVQNLVTVVGKFEKNGYLHTNLIVLIKLLSILFFFFLKEIYLTICFQLICGIEKTFLGDLTSWKCCFIKLFPVCQS